MTTLKVLWIGAAGAMSVAGAAEGAVFTSQATFAGNLTSGYYQETFQSRAISGYGTPMTFAGGAGNAWSYSATTTAQAFLVFDLAGDHYLTTSGEFGTGWSRPITLTFTGAPVYAVGGSFFFTSVGGAVVGGNVSVNLSDGTSVGLGGQSNTTFWGYIGTTPITSLVVTPDATHHFVSIDNLYVGTSSLPAPGAAGLLGACLAMGMGRRRR